MAINDAKLAYVKQKMQNARFVAVNKTINHFDGSPLRKRLVFEELKSFAEAFIAGNRADRWMLMPGLRGTGKSTLLAHLYLYLVEEMKVIPNDVLFMSVDHVVEQLGCGIHDVLESYEWVVGERFESAKRLKFLLLDEAHFDIKWKSALKDVYERAPNVMIIVTGSSALAQSDSSIGADIARRTRRELIEPLRFHEYLALQNKEVAAELGQEVIHALFASKDANEVMAKLAASREKVNDFRARFTGEDVEKYLLCGSFPFVLGLNKEEAFDRILRLTKDVLLQDIPRLHAFDAATLAKFTQLVTLLAAWEDVSLQKLSNALRLSIVTVVQMIDALEKSELLRIIPTYGGVKVRVTRPPRYALGATGIKAALLWDIGTLSPSPDQYGKFLEDLFIQYFSTERSRRTGDIFRREGAGEADFVLETPIGDRIACEISYGNKSTEQVEKTMSSVDCKYGILISGDVLAVRGNVVVVPKEYLLTY